MRPTEVPVERLASNAAAYAKEHPEDAMGWYTLARIHYLAFVMNSESLNASADKDGELPRLHPFQNEAGAGKGKNPEPETAVKHVSEALRCFDKAIELKKDDALFLLGKASLLDQYMDAGRQKLMRDVKGKPKAVTVEEISALYLKAFDAAKAKDAAQRNKPLLGMKDLVSHEAGKAYLEKNPKGERAEEITEHLAKLNALPMGPVTPVIAAQAGSIHELFDGKNASFDITGLGWKQTYPWPGAHAAFVVWDPLHTGAIADGKQLFGFYTWGIFWKDG
ncbi:MAG: hypothetical protein WCN98_20560, partial [Verrucomicrobiaceae bacterium]